MNRSRQDGDNLRSRHAQLQGLRAWENYRKRAPKRMARALRNCIISLRIYEGIHGQSKNISFFVVETWLFGWGVLTNTYSRPKRDPQVEPGLREGGHFQIHG